MHCSSVAPVFLAVLAILWIPPSNTAAQGEAVQKMTANGTEFAVVDKGRGDPIVLVHGALADHRSWAPAAEAFSNKYRVIAYSRRYHYPNPSAAADGTEYTVAGHAADLAALTRTLGLPPVHLVGQSYGANVAALTAIQHPELVRSLVLAEPSLYSLIANSSDPELQASNKERDTTTQHVRELLKRGEQAQAVQTFFNYVMGPGDRDRTPPHTLAIRLDNASTLLPMITPSSPLPPFTCDHARQIKAPTLLLGGELSIKPFRAILDELQKCVPSSERVMLPSANHALAAASPKQFHEAVLAFVARH